MDPSHPPHIDDKQFDIEHYNVQSHYHHFTEDLRASFRGDRLRIGDVALPGFALPTLEGTMVDLEVLSASKYTALVFGSYSAPPCCYEMPALQALHEKCLGTEFAVVFIYTCEIHPNEVIAPNFKAMPAHATSEQKQDCARQFRDDLGLSFPICVDDLRGTTHRAYGALAFQQVVVDKTGKLIHRAEWADASLLEAVKDNLIRRDEREETWRLANQHVANPGRRIPESKASFAETIWFQ